MTLILDHTMTPEEKQDKILEASSNATDKKLKALLALREKRRKIRKQLGKDVMKLEKSPLTLQRKWRDE